MKLAADYNILLGKWTWCGIWCQFWTQTLHKWICGYYWIIRDWYIRRVKDREQKILWQGYFSNNSPFGRIYNHGCSHHYYFLPPQMKKLLGQQFNKWTSRPCWLIRVMMFNNFFFFFVMCWFLNAYVLVSINIKRYVEIYYCLSLQLYIYNGFCFCC